MGYLGGNQLAYIFSVKNEGYRDFEFPKETQPYFIVDDQQFNALGLRNVSGELVITTENGLSLQRALNQAKSLGIRVKLPNTNQSVDAAWLDLQNIPAAVRWLDACNVVGAGALSK
jgi:hypothetical protein